jgi:hypothetical protein
LANGHQLDPAKRSQTPTSKYHVSGTKAFANRTGSQHFADTYYEFSRKMVGSGAKIYRLFSGKLRDQNGGMGGLFRDVSIPDTTAHAEAFHNILKRVYCSKRNRCMETLLQKLMKYEEDMFIKNRGYDD